MKPWLSILLTILLALPPAIGAAQVDGDGCDMGMAQSAEQSPAMSETCGDCTDNCNDSACVLACQATAGLAFMTADHGAVSPSLSLRLGLLGQEHIPAGYRIPALRPPISS